MFHKSYGQSLSHLRAHTGAHMGFTWGLTWGLTWAPFVSLLLIANEVNIWWSAAGAGPEQQQGSN